ncbi:MAG TPA: hypothetical protein VE993_15270 [Stellaceae bacterium]|nr:hypothetical protein [Stellaceae bacterium]
MRAGETKEAVQLLDLLLEFFADGARWMRGRYHDGRGRNCLIGAVAHLRRKHRLAGAAALEYLHQALPRRTLGLVYFNDHRCRDFAELRAVILKARALALGEADRERSAAAVERWLRAELKKDHAARAAAGADRPTPFSQAA